LKKRATLTRAESARLSLQISERRKSSDLYGLIPFIVDPAIQQYLATLLKVGLGALAKYALQSVLSNDSKAKPGSTTLKAGDVQDSVLTGAIYAETVQITNHINNIGGIELIEITPSEDLKTPIIQLTPDTQKYVRDIANESYRGAYEEITGYVTRLLPNRLVAQIKVAPSRYVKVGLTEDHFQFVRYKTESEQRLRFKGHPIVKLGKDESTYKEFEAESVELAEV
jgi:hypothetical protein